MAGRGSREVAGTGTEGVEGCLGCMRNGHHTTTKNSTLSVDTHSVGQTGHSTVSLRCNEITKTYMMRKI